MLQNELSLRPCEYCSVLHRLSAPHSSCLIQGGIQKFCRKPAIQASRIRRETPDPGELEGNKHKCHSQSVSQIAFWKSREHLAREGHHERCNNGRRSWVGDFCPGRVD